MTSLDFLCFDLIEFDAVVDVIRDQVSDLDGVGDRAPEFEAALFEKAYAGFVGSHEDGHQILEADPSALIHEEPEEGFSQAPAVI